MSSAYLHFEKQVQCSSENPEEEASRREPSVLLLADDLTGACDSGLAFVKAGRTVCVQIRAELGNVATSQADVIAISTETRNLSADESEDRLSHLAPLRNFPGSVLFHKVDSAGRGNPGREMLAITRIAQCDGIVYAPAFPAGGRMVRDGVLHIRDVSGQDAEISLLSLIPESALAMVGLIRTGDELLLRREMEQAREVGKKIWLCDAQRQEDLVHVVRAASSLGARLLWVGSAGLAGAVAESLHIESSLQPIEMVFRTFPGCTIVLCGTMHPVTGLQMDHLAKDAPAFQFDGESAIPASSCVMVRIKWGTVTREAVRAFWERLHQAGRTPVRSLVLSGGDTAAFILKALDATSIRLGGEVEPGIPWGVVADGVAKGCVVVTKSGGFGVVTSLKNAVDFCTRLRA